MEKDAMLLAGTLAGFIAAILSILEKLLDLKERFRPNEQEEETQPSAPAVQAAPRPRSIPAWKLLQCSSYLLWYELAVIVGAGVVLNYLGLLLSLRLQSILYLDMIGTALSALLLGPWWGALVALLSSALVNWLLYPEPGADVVIFPWVLVNMTGAFCWGLMARRPMFRKYVKSPRASAVAHASYLVTFGVLAACVMAVPGAVIQSALDEPSVFALNADVAQAIQGLIEQWQEAFEDQVDNLFGIAAGGSVAWALFNWIQNCIRYIPDKTISVAIALTLVKYAFPLFERELLHGQGKHRLRDTVAAPLVLAAMYLPVYLALVLANDRLASYWPLWSVPWIVMLGGLLVLGRRGPSDQATHAAGLARAERYGQALKPARREPAHEFGQRLTIATLIASVLFALALPLVLTDFYQAAFNFFCVVYGFLIAVFLVRVSISQNISMARAEK